MIEGLPPDPTSQQNASIITYPHSRTWPLILDPLGIAEQWLIKQENQAMIVQYQVTTGLVLDSPSPWFLGMLTYGESMCNNWCPYKTAQGGDVEGEYAP